MTAAEVLYTGSPRVSDYIQNADVVINSTAIGDDVNQTNRLLSDSGWTAVTSRWQLSQTAVVTALLITAYSLVALLSVVSNTIVVTVINQVPQLRTVTNFFLANLAVADLIVTFTVLPITLLANLFRGWPFGWFMCKAVPYLQGVAVSASVNTLTAVAIERYCVIFYPSQTIVTSRRAAIIVGFIWAVPIVLQSPWTVLQSLGHSSTQALDYCYMDVPTYQLMARLFFVCVMVLTCYLVPLVAITIFYSLVGWRVKQRKVEGIRGSKTERSIRQSKIRILRMLVAQAVLFALSWLPLYSLRLRILFGPPMDAQEKMIVMRYATPIFQWVSSTNSCINPFIYCYFSQQFRTGMLAVLRRFCGGLSRPCGYHPMNPTSVAMTVANGDLTQHVTAAAATSSVRRDHVDRRQSSQLQVITLMATSDGPAARGFSNDTCITADL